MALSFSPTWAAAKDGWRTVGGTFTGVPGDNSGTLSGFDIIVDYQVKFDGELAGQSPKFALSGTPPTLTVTFDDLTHATTGTYYIRGR